MAPPRHADETTPSHLPALPVSVAPRNAGRRGLAPRPGVSDAALAALLVPTGRKVGPLRALAVKVAKANGFPASDPTVDDLEAEGAKRLVELAKSFDPSKAPAIAETTDPVAVLAAQLWAYATAHVRAAMLDYLTLAQAPVSLGNGSTARRERHRQAQDATWLRSGSGESEDPEDIGAPSAPSHRLRGAAERSKDLGGLNNRTSQTITLEQYRSGLVPVPGRPSTDRQTGMTPLLEGGNTAAALNPETEGWLVGSEPIDPTQVSEAARRLPAAFESLCPRDRGVLQLLVEGNTQREIAAQIGVSQSAITRTLARCRRTLAPQLGLSID